MNRINETLATIGCGITDLPKPFQERINAITKLATQVEEANKAYEENPTEEEKEKLEDIQNYYEDFVLETCDMIETWDEDVKDKKAKHEAEAKTEAEKKAKEQEESKNKTPMPTPNDDPAPKKKGLGLGGIILGVAVLAITMGAVNTMRSK